MSEAALTKIQKDCSKLEAELEVYKTTLPLSQTCDSIVSYIHEQPEPLIMTKADSNPWHKTPSSGGGCLIC